MTVARPVIEQTIREFCVTDDTETAIDRIEIWLAIERRSGAVDALRQAAARWPLWKVGRVWLTALADQLEKNGGQL